MCSGGGIGGLALAMILGKYGSLPVELFEAGPEIETVGAGIGFFSRTVDIMKELGLYDELAQLAIRPPQNNDGKLSQCMSSNFVPLTLFGPLTLHRRDLINVLLQHLPASCNIHTSKKLLSYFQDDATNSLVMNFADGTSAKTDVLIGADGVRSATRKTMFQEMANNSSDTAYKKWIAQYMDPIWTGILAYRCLISTEKLHKTFPDVAAPQGLTMVPQHIVAYPVSQGRLINVAIFSHNPDAYATQFEGRWVTEVPEQEIVDQYADWEPAARALVQCVEKPSRWALHVVKTLPNYVSGRVAILGDAAHGMEPHFGAGAGQAIEDAFIIGRLLTHESTQKDNIAEALRLYEEVRLPYANNILQKSENVGRLYCFRKPLNDGTFFPAGSPEEMDYVRTSIEEEWAWQCVGGSLRDWELVKSRWEELCTQADKA
ncbi:FAD/NAD(P)-binding domain-containing protein [Leucogyrophana mollusca]|uniref:FAD/NAD(P)-binding domain-containing protein n=1 Tax=Leucogyrophana mollusca TaxID=85980 RepID=A0ACB8BEM2_9AGAM|nr:FAD/NAD(P)-binding domain-containing protein [Leucogyrophana mollusca]